MFSQGVLFVAIAIFQYAASTCDEDSTVEPVELNFVCFEPDVSTQKSQILFIHGLTGSWDNWNSVKGLVNKTGRKACAIDLRNHGDSPWTNRTDVASMTADIEHFLQKHGITKCNVIGHSLGGKVGVHFTLRNPAIVNSLVVEDMRPNGVTEQAISPIQKGLLAIKNALMQVPEGATLDQARGIMYEYIKSKREEGVDTGFNENVAFIIEIQCSSGICQLKYNIVALANAIQNPQCFLGDSKGLYRGPALFIYGEESEFDVGGDKNNIEILFPNASLVGVPNAGHGIHGFFPDFEDEVTKLLNNIDS